MPDGSGFSHRGLVALIALTGQIAGTRQGNDAVAGFLTLNAWDAKTVHDAMAHGAGKAYAIAYAKYVESTVRDTSFVLRSLEEVSLPDTRVALQSAAAADVRKLAKREAEMAWVAQNVCQPLGPELGQKAMDGYLAYKSAEDKLEDEKLRTRVADDGVKLFKHMLARDKIARDVGLAPAMQEQLVALAQDEPSCLAIQTAIEKHPELLQGDGLNDVVALLETLRNDRPPTWGDNSPSRFTSTPAGARLALLPALGLKLANVAATAYLRETVVRDLGKIRFDDLASREQVT